MFPLLFKERKRKKFGSDIEIEVNLRGTRPQEMLNLVISSKYVSKNN